MASLLFLATAWVPTGASDPGGEGAIYEGPLPFRVVRAPEAAVGKRADTAGAAAVTGATGGAFVIANTTASQTLNYFVDCGGTGEGNTHTAPPDSLSYHLCGEGDHVEITLDENLGAAVELKTYVVLFGETRALVLQAGRLLLQGTTVGRLQVHGGRFSLFLSWVGFGTDFGVGRVVPFQTGVAGFFVYDFFDQQDFQLIAKVINGCGSNGNGRYWVFAGGATNLYVTLSVVDHSGKSSIPVRVYSSPRGPAFEAITDTQAFDGCP